MILEWRERRKKKFMKDICKIVGHEWYVYSPQQITLPNRRDCVRCFGIVQLSKNWEHGDYVWIDTAWCVQ